MKFTKSMLLAFKVFILCNNVQEHSVTVSLNDELKSMAPPLKWWTVYWESRRGTSSPNPGGANKCYEKVSLLGSTGKK